MKKTRTRLAAIAAKCHDCTYDQKAPGTALAQIEACQTTDCSLHPYRPMTSVTKKRLREERLAAMTPEERARHRVRQEATRNRLSTGKKPAIKRIRRIRVSDAPKFGQIMEDLK